VQGFHYRTVEKSSYKRGKVNIVTYFDGIDKPAISQAVIQTISQLFCTQILRRLFRHCKENDVYEFPRKLSACTTVQPKLNTKQNEKQCSNNPVQTRFGSNSRHVEKVVKLSTFITKERSISGEIIKKTLAICTVPIESCSLRI
jgi:hypothetical protein